MANARALFAVIFYFCSIPTAAAQTGSATLSGTVVAAGGGAVQSVTLVLYTSDGNQRGTAFSDASGAFSFTSLAAGTYYLIAQANSTYVQEIYDGIHCTVRSSNTTACSPRTGTPIAIADGQTRTITVTLDVGGTISGRILSAATGQPVAGTPSAATVRIYDAAGVPVLGPGVSVVTASDGSYTFSGLAAGRYYIRAVTNRFVTNLLDEIYDNRPCFAALDVDECDPLTGTPVTVTLGGTVSGVDILLDAGGTITGTVLFTDGQRLGIPVVVTAYRGSVRIAQTTTSNSGAYTLTGLFTGTYSIRAEPGGSFTDAWRDAVSVTAGSTTSDIDMITGIGGSIRGTVTRPQSSIGAAPRVSVYDERGVLVKFASAPGAYVVDGLPAGTYYVRAEDPIDFGSRGGTFPSGFLIPKLYDNITCVNVRCAVTSGTPVKVVAAQATAGIDFTLETGAQITGIIKGASDSDTLSVELYDAEGVRVDRVVRSFNGFVVPPTPMQGYVARGLPPGPYYLRTVSPRFLDEAWNDVPCESCPPLTGTPIVLAAEEVRNGIDFTLDLAPVVTGTVRDASTGAPLANVTVELYGANGQLASSATTDNAGQYSLPAAPGRYFARTRDSRGYADQAYPSDPCAACAFGGTPPLVVSAAGASGVDFALTAGVRVSGTVSVPGVGVTVFDGAQKPVAQPVAQTSGAWSATVVPGTYYARTNPYPGYALQLYKNLPCPGGTCDPRTGTPIAAASSVSGVDFNLQACAATAPALPPATQMAATTGVAFHLGLYPSRSGAPGTFSLTSAVLPPGLALDTVTGVISGTPTAAGSYTFSVSLVTGAGCAYSQTYSIHVSACSTIVNLSNVATIPTAPGPGPVRIDAGASYFVMPAAGGREDVSLVGTCSPSAVFAATTVSDTWLHVSGPDVVNGQTQPTGSVTVDANPSTTQSRTGYVVFNGRAVQVRQAPQSSAAPFGVVDFPIEGYTVQGPTPVSGWVLDDLGVTRVRIYRDAVPPEPAGTLVYIGDGSFVKGARSDVEKLYRSMPSSDRAGWGYLLLTNVLPGQGNGTYRLTVFADDAEGHTSLIGTRTFVADNAHATIPFGTFDTPAEGATISGTDYPVFGWALTPQPKTIPKDGSTVKLYIDSQLVGTLDYNHFRQDVFDTFSTLNNADGAVGFRVIDTTQLNDGMHTIGMLVTDDAGATAGIGSRFFSVQNNGASLALTAAIRDAIAEGARVDAGRRAASLQALRSVPTRVVRAGTLDRIALRLADGLDEGACLSSVAGYDASSGELRPLPVGSTLDAGTGRFSWQPGPGFVGSYELVFVRTYCDGTRERIPITLILRP